MYLEAVVVPIIDRLYAHSTRLPLNYPDLDKAQRY